MLRSRRLCTHQLQQEQSGYIVSLGLFRSQTAANVLEIYRRAAGEYNVPKVMLTDNSRQSELKRTLAHGVAENALELALRGTPQDPFYMVGRMNGQNVVIRAEKGKVRMMVDEEDGHQGKELVYNLNMEEIAHGHAEENQKSSEVYGGGETQGCSHGLDGTQERSRGLQGDEAQLNPVGPLAESGNGGNACSPLTEAERTVTTIEQPPGETTYEEAVGPERWVCEVGRSVADLRRSYRHDIFYNRWKSIITILTKDC